MSNWRFVIKAAELL